MKMGRTSLVLCIAFWIAFALFAIVREPSIHSERDLDGGSAMSGYYSSQPLTYIAGRPLYSWPSWHGGESFPVKVLEVLNLPALAAAHAAAEPVAKIVFSSSRSYYLVSWVRAWLFVALGTLQWILIGMLIDSWRRRRARQAVAT